MTETFNGTTTTLGTVTATDTIPFADKTFTKDPGIGGLVLINGTNQPKAGVRVQIYNGSNTLLATVYTDHDGWYIWRYKYIGKAAEVPPPPCVFSLGTAFLMTGQAIAPNALRGNASIRNCTGGIAFQ